MWTRDIDNEEKQRLNHMDNRKIETKETEKFWMTRKH